MKLCNIIFIWSRKLFINLIQRCVATDFEKWYYTELAFYREPYKILLEFFVKP